MVSSLRIPTYVNAFELAAFIMEKRGGIRIEYSNSTSPSINEINDRLLASESSVTKLMNNSWRPNPNTYETTWVKYKYPYSYWRAKYWTFSKALNPPSITLVHHPIISIEKLEIIISNAFVDLVASSDYEEGWDKDYWIDTRNGIIEFRNTKPKYRTPVRINYTHGRIESEDGDITYEGSVKVITGSTETSFTVDVVTPSNKYNGKLIKMTSGNNVDGIYRISKSIYVSDETTLTVKDGYVMYTDGVRDGDTFEIYEVDADIKEMVKIYTYLGILVADPTYQHNFTNPFDEPNPQWRQFEWLAGRFHALLSQRKSVIQLVS